MSVSVTLNGINYTIPQYQEQGWANQVTAWIQAVSSSVLQKSGGSFTLTADANFGATYGLIAGYFTSATSNASTAGVLRLANTEKVAWRNAANNANLGIALDASNHVVFDAAPSFSTIINTGTLTLPTSTDTLVGKATTDTLTNKTYDTSTNTFKSTGATTGTVLTSDGSGGTSWTVGSFPVDGVTLDTSGSGSSLEIKTGGVGTTQLASGAVTQAKRAALGEQTAFVSNFSTTSGTEVDITGASVSITTTGRPVLVAFFPKALANGSFNLTSVTSAVLNFDRGGSNIAGFSFALTATQLTVPFFTIESPAAATYTYKARATSDGTHTLNIQNYTFFVCEL